MTDTWAPDIYTRYQDERDRPFYELMQRIPGPVRHIADLGCGDGRLTRTLITRDPEAQVTGVDASAEMLHAAHTDTPRLVFVHADLATWTPPRPLDLIVSNAALHWVPDHPALVRRLVGLLEPGGRLAVQVPMNHEAPSHRVVREVAHRPEWHDLLGDLGAVHVLAPPRYLEVLHGLGCTTDLWTTTYHHVLAGQEAVLRWLEGTTLRPYLSRLDPEAGPRFLDDVGAALRPHYPAAGGRVVFPFTRLFFVATRPA